MRNGQPQPAAADCAQWMGSRVIPQISLFFCFLVLALLSLALPT